MFTPAEQHYPSLFLMRGPKPLSDLGTYVLPLSRFPKLLDTLVLV